MLVNSHSIVSFGSIFKPKYNPIAYLDSPFVPNIKLAMLFGLFPIYNYSSTNNLGFLLKSKMFGSFELC